MGSLFGNPHSASASSDLASQRIDNVRLKVLRFFNASPDHFDVVFVANATAGIKLVMDAFRGMEDGFWFGYHKDAHTSLVGVRETAIRGSRCFTSDQDVESWLEEESGDSYPRLFAYPAQSNMNGRRLPLTWCSRIRASARRHIYSLLDVASLVSTSPLDLSDAASAPDFIVLSFYKIFGFPDLGALIVCKDSGAIFKHRQYFSGGTVDVVTCLDQDWHLMKEDAIHSRLEDGTLPVHSIVALDCAISVHETLYGTLEQISTHVSYLARLMYEKLKLMQHSNGLPVCQFYNDTLSSYDDSRTQGPIIAFNLRDSRGNYISSHELQKLTTLRNIHLRAGNICNPGGVASSLGLSSWDLRKSYIKGFRCGNNNDTSDGRPLGVIRISLGAMNVLEDIVVLIDFIDEFFVDKSPIHEPKSHIFPVSIPFYVESLTIYPIKSCGGWRVPSDMSWAIRPEGLVWDREWCVIHQGTRTTLSQKNFPKMALFKPTLDLANFQLCIQYTGPKSVVNAPREISISFSFEPSHFMGSNNHHDDRFSQTNVCGDKIQPRIYNSAAITSFFSTHLDVPVYLARFSTDLSTPFSPRHMKAMPSFAQIQDGGLGTCIDKLPGFFPTPPPSPPARPLLLSNESPILVISRSSVNKVNAEVERTGGKRVKADVFRANIVLAQDTADSDKEATASETPFVEDTWNGIEFLRRQENTYIKQHRDSKYFMHSSDDVSSLKLEVFGPCRRCQMVCIDQDTGEKGQEPLTTLAKTRKRSGGLWFGIHAGLMLRDLAGNIPEETSIKAGDQVTTW